MRLPRPRLTVRRLMLRVASAGILLGGAEWLRRRRAFAIGMAGRHQDLFFDVMYSPGAVEAFGSSKEHADCHLKMETKWFRAARSPRLPVGPDASEPQ